MKRLLLITGLLCGLLTSLYAQENMKTQVNTQEVAVFKNGQGFFMKSLEVQPEKNLERLTELPNARYGTFWLGSSQNPIQSVRSVERLVQEERSVKSIADALRALEGKKVVLSLSDNTKAEGKVSFTDNSGVILRQDDGGSIFLQASAIRYFSTSEAVPEVYEQESEKRVLEILFENNKRTDLDLMYLSKGIGWLPKYRVKLREDDADIILSATLINDAEDLKDASVKLVVGVPTFKYEDNDAPLLSSQSVQQLISMLNGSGSMGSIQPMRNMVTTQSMMRFDVDGDAGGFDEGFSSSSSEDLFLYTQKGINLPKGGRADYVLFRDKIPFSHIYEVTLPGNRPNYYRTVRDSENEVWHSVRLSNETDFPWTTGPALVLKDEGKNQSPQVLSQGLLNYTPRKSTSLLKLTIAPDVLVKDSEKEISRESNKKQKDGNYYDIALVEGKIEVKNFKDKEIDLSINREVKGLPETSDSPWAVIKKVNFYDPLNNQNDIEWKLKLKKGEEKTITYKYKIFIKR